jgi:hypothetical protein
LYWNQVHNHPAVDFGNKAADVLESVGRSRF